MLQTKEALAEAVAKLCRLQLKDISFKARSREIADALEKNHGISVTQSSDILSLRVDLIDESEFILFCVMEQLDKSLLSKYFTDNEIKDFSITKLKKVKIKFPLRYDVIQVTETQWIGATTVNELMQLYDAQLINYNENAQRTLKRMVSGGVEYYKIDINRNAVNGIIDSYKTDMYIPNTITLGIPETTEFIYKDKQLLIKSIEAFDILDGYHRLVAMANIHAMDKKFDYPMEIRFVSFSEDKAKQFIWQEDQKTKMSKMDSESFNQNNYGNQVIAMLDQVTALHGIINRNGKVSAGYASAIINLLYFNERRIYNRKELVKVKDEIKCGLMEVLDSNPEIFDKRFSFKEVVALFFVIYQGHAAAFEHFYNHIKDLELSSHLNKRDLTRLEKAYEGFN